MIGRAVRGLLLAAVVLTGAAGFWLGLEMNRPPAAGAPETVLLRKGDSPAGIARTLVREGVLRRSEPFLFAYRFFHAPRTMKAGEYRVRRPGPAGSVRDLLLDILRGRVVVHLVTVPEGLTLDETGELLAGSPVLDASALPGALGDVSRVADWDRAARDLEGYLFPETYSVTRGTPAADVVGDMVGQFRAAFEGAWLRRAAELGWSVRQVVTLASLVEKETAVPGERARVSAVFHNRLRLGMRLDCDPTVIYALKREGLYRGRILLRDLRFESPWNTYVHAGLPPGPICSPGRASLEAALYPSAEDSLFFVAAGDGTHRFSRTLREHAAAVREYRLKKG